MIDNPTFATDLAPLIAQLAAGTITQAAFATSVANLLDQWNVQVSTGALSQTLSALSAQVAQILTQFSILTIQGTVATITALPASASNGSLYVVQANNHAYARITGQWLDIGPFQGPQGVSGLAATVSVSPTVTTTSPGTPATVTNQGTNAAAVFAFSIPQGPQGATGPSGTLSIGSVTTGAAGSSATVTNAGTSQAAILNFALPQGPQGVQGPSGTLAVGTVTTGAPGSSATVANAGTSQAAILNFAIPQGAPGAAATVAVGSVATGAPGSSATVTNVGTSTAAIFNFSIPQGATGASGPAAWKTPVAWATGTAYVVGPPASVVTQGGSSYVCLVPHTAGTFATDLGAGKWQLIAAAGANGAGAGNVNSSGSITAGHFPSYGDATGNALVDSGFNAASFEQVAHKGAASGYAPLDATSKVPLANLPAAVAGALNYAGTWNASTNSPALSSSTGTTGQFYKVSTAGTTTLNGVSTWNVGDLLIFDGTSWDKVEGQPTDVTSVAGLVGAITAAALKVAIAISVSDISGLGTAATLNAGTAANNVVVLDANAKLPAVDGSQLTGVAPTALSVTNALGYTPVNPSNLGTAASQAVGTAVGNVVQVQTGGKLPALDGSQLTNLLGGAPIAQTASFTAAVNKSYALRGTALAVALPASPGAGGGTVEVMGCMGTEAASPHTVTLNGSDVINYAGSTYTTATMTKPGVAYLFVPRSGGWDVVLGG